MRSMHLSRLEIAASGEDARRADSCLNHLLKNKSAEARFLIEEVTDGICAIKQAVRVGQPHKVGSIFGGLVVWWLGGLVVW